MPGAGILRGFELHAAMNVSATKGNKAVKIINKGDLPRPGGVMDAAPCGDSGQQW